MHWLCGACVDAALREQRERAVVKSAEGAAESAYQLELAAGGDHGAAAVTGHAVEQAVLVAGGGSASAVAAAVDGTLSNVRIAAMAAAVSAVNADSAGATGWSQEEVSGVLPPCPICRTPVRFVQGMVW